MPKELDTTCGKVFHDEQDEIFIDTKYGRLSADLGMCPKVEILSHHGQPISVVDRSDPTDPKVICIQRVPKSQHIYTEGRGLNWGLVS